MPSLKIRMISNIFTKSRLILWIVTLKRFGRLQILPTRVNISCLVPIMSWNRIKGNYQLCRSGQKSWEGRKEWNAIFKPSNARVILKSVNARSTLRIIFMKIKMILAPFSRTDSGLKNTQKVELRNPTL